MIEIHQEEGCIRVRGRWDASQNEKGTAVFGKVEESIPVDLSDLEYISSAGLSVLVKAQLRLQEKGQRLTLINAQPRVRVVFSFANLEGFFGMA